MALFESLIANGVISNKIPSFVNLKAIANSKWDTTDENNMNNFIYLLLDGMSLKMVNQEQVFELDEKLHFIDEELVNATEELYKACLINEKDMVSRMRLFMAVDYFGSLDMWRISYGDAEKIGLTKWFSRKQFMNVFKDVKGCKSCIPGEWATFSFCFNPEGRHKPMGNLARSGKPHTPTCRYFVCTTKDGWFACPSSDTKIEILT